MCGRAQNALLWVVCVVGAGRKGWQARAVGNARMEVNMRATNQLGLKPGTLFCLFLLFNDSVVRSSVGSN